MKATVVDRLLHIKQAIEQINRLCNAFSDDEIRSEPFNRAALERFIEIISEASRHITPEMRALHPAVPWRQIADIGNVLRHNYEGVVFDTILEIARVEVRDLERAIDEMKLLDDRPPTQRQP